MSSDSTGSSSAPSSPTSARGRRLSMSGKVIPRPSRRDSIHASGEAAKQIKRNFYGIEEANDFFMKEVWGKHSEAVINVCIVFSFYLIGGIFYHATEGWSYLDCFYYQTVTLCTVGYGDLSPQTDRGRLFTIFYIFAGIAIVLRIINDFAQGVLDYAEQQALLRMKSSRNKLAAEGDTRTVGGWHLSPHTTKILTALGSIALCLLMGTIFYMNNEKWDFITALYFSVVTTSTVGYGDTPLTLESSRMFAIFYILSSCVIVAVAIANLGTVQLEIASEKKRLNMLQRKLDFNMIRELDKDGSGIDKASFLVAMLVQLELIDKEKDANPWLKRFDELDTNKSGVLNLDICIDALEKEEQERLDAIQAELEKEEKEKFSVHELLGNATSLFSLMQQHATTSTPATTSANANVEAGGAGGGAAFTTNPMIPKSSKLAKKRASIEMQATAQATVQAV